MSLVVYGSDSEHPVFSERVFNELIPSGRKLRLESLWVILTPKADSTSPQGATVWEIKCNNVKRDAVQYGVVPTDCIEVTPAAKLEQRRIYLVEWVHPSDGMVGYAEFYLDEIDGHVAVINFKAGGFSINSYSQSFEQFRNYYIIKNKGGYQAVDVAISNEDFTRRINPYIYDENNRTGTFNSSSSISK